MKTTMIAVGMSALLSTGGSQAYGAIKFNVFVIGTDDPQAKFTTDLKTVLIDPFFEGAPNFGATTPGGYLFTPGVTLAIEAIIDDGADVAFVSAAGTLAASRPRGIPQFEFGYSGPIIHSASAGYEGDNGGPFVNGIPWTPAYGYRDGINWSAGPTLGPRTFSESGTIRYLPSTARIGSRHLLGLAQVRDVLDDVLVDSGTFPPNRNISCDISFSLAVSDQNGFGAKWRENGVDFSSDTGLVRYGSPVTIIQNEPGAGLPGTIPTSVRTGLSVRPDVRGGAEISVIEGILVPFEDVFNDPLTAPKVTYDLSSQYRGRVAILIATTASLDEMNRRFAGGIVNVTQLAAGGRYNYAIEWDAPALGQINLGFDPIEASQGLPAYPAAVVTAIAVVPEPATTALIGGVLVGFVSRRRRESDHN